MCMCNTCLHAVRISHFNIAYILCAHVCTPVYCYMCVRGGRMGWGHRQKYCSLTDTVGLCVSRRRLNVYFGGSEYVAGVSWGKGGAAADSFTTNLEQQ